MDEAFQNQSGYSKVKELLGKSGKDSFVAEYKGIKDLEKNSGEMVYFMPSF